MVPVSNKLIEATFTAGDAGTGTLQEQLHARLRGAILQGTLAPGTRLPSSRALAEQQAISRNTVIAAYDQLIAEGYLETRQGAGTFVTHDLPESFLQTRTAPDTLHDQAHKEKATELHTGLPAVDAFPMDVWARLNSRAWRQASSDLLYHNDPMGYLPLRRTIATYLASSRSVQASPEQIMIISGLQQGLKLVADSLLSPDDTIILEDPGYGGLLHTAKHCNAQLSFTGIDTQGAQIPTQKTGKSLLVVSPSHQYPLGITMPTKRRLELLEWAQETGSLIFEDDYDSEFRYGGRPLNALQGIAGGANVIYGGSFSKTTFPALRLGYIVLPEALLPAVLARRQATDSFPSIMSQLALSTFMEEGHFARHLRRLRKIHASRLSVYSRAFQAHMAPYFTLQPSEAGLDMVAFPTEVLRTSALKCDTLWAQVFQKAGLSALPLSATYRKAPPKQGLLLGFANFAEDKLPDLMARLAQKMLVETGF